MVPAGPGGRLLPVRRRRERRRRRFRRSPAGAAGLVGRHPEGLPDDDGLRRRGRGRRRPGSTAFKAANPDVQVKNNKGDFDAQQFLTAVSSGNPPDLVSWTASLLGTYAAKGVIQPLDRLHQAAEDRHRPVPPGGPDVGHDRRQGLRDPGVLHRHRQPHRRQVAEGGRRRPASAIQTKDWDAAQATAEKLYKADGRKVARIGYDPKLPDSFPLWARANGVEIVERRRRARTSTTRRPSRPSTTPSASSRPRAAGRTSSPSATLRHLRRGEPPHQGHHSPPSRWRTGTSTSCATPSRRGSSCTATPVHRPAGTDDQHRSAARAGPSRRARRTPSPRARGPRR